MHEYHSIHCEITGAHWDDKWPFALDLEIVDIHERRWKFLEKFERVDVESSELVLKGRFPQRGSFQCTLLGEQTDRDDRRVARIMTSEPSGPESVEGHSIFDVWASEVQIGKWPTWTRLGQVGMDVSNAFRIATFKQKLRAVHVAIDMAVKHAELDSPLLSFLLTELQDGRGPNPEMASELRALATRLNGEFLEKLFAGETPQAMTPECDAAYRKTKAASAMVFATTAEAGALAEAIYESTLALKNRWESRDNVLSALQAVE